MGLGQERDTYRLKGGSDELIIRKGSEEAKICRKGSQIEEENDSSFNATQASKGHESDKTDNEGKSKAS
jgi:hypothetical protein